MQREMSEREEQRHVRQRVSGYEEEDPITKIDRWRERGGGGEGEREGEGEGEGGGDRDRGGLITSCLLWAEDQRGISIREKSAGPRWSQAGVKNHAKWLALAVLEGDAAHSQPWIIPASASVLSCESGRGRGRLCVKRQDTWAWNLGRRREGFITRFLLQPGLRTSLAVVGELHPGSQVTWCARRKRVLRSGLETFNQWAGKEEKSRVRL
jgi:hypothetical protein